MGVYLHTFTPFILIQSKNAKRKLRKENLFYESNKIGQNLNIPLSLNRRNLNIPLIYPICLSARFVAMKTHFLMKKSERKNIRPCICQIVQLPQVAKKQKHLKTQHPREAGLTFLNC